MPMAAEPPQPAITHRPPAPKVLLGEQGRAGTLAAPPPNPIAAGGIAVNRKPHPSRRLARQHAVLAAGYPRSPQSPPQAASVPGCWRVGPGW